MNNDTKAAQPQAAIQAPAEPSDPCSSAAAKRFHDKLNLRFPPKPEDFGVPAAYADHARNYANFVALAAPAPTVAAPSDGPFKREHRYIVAKYKDMLSFLTEDQQRALIELHKIIDAGRESAGKRYLECICIESDWPEYPVAWAMIEERMTGVKHGIPDLEERRKDGMNGTREDCLRSEVAELRAALAAPTGASQSAGTNADTKQQGILLAGLQALCVSADQEWTRQSGKLSGFDKGWFMGQIQSIDFYTDAEKDAVYKCREYIEKLSAPAPSLYEAQRNAAEAVINGEFDRLFGPGETAAQRPATPSIPEDDLCTLLPGSYYMDPPDGGSVSVMEQLRRMADDAALYRRSQGEALAPGEEFVYQFRQKGGGMGWVECTHDERERMRKGQVGIWLEFRTLYTHPALIQSQNSGSIGDEAEFDTLICRYRASTDATARSFKAKVIAYIDSRTHPAAMPAQASVVPDPYSDQYAMLGRLADKDKALVIAEAALSDIGDADREPGDDLAWCEQRAAEALPAVRAAMPRHSRAPPPPAPAPAIQAQPLTDAAHAARYLWITRTSGLRISLPGRLALKTAEETDAAIDAEIAKLSGQAGTATNQHHGSCVCDSCVNPNL